MTGNVSGGAKGVETRGKWMSYVARTLVKDHVGQVANLRRVANPPSGGWRTPAHQVFHPNPCPPGGQDTLVKTPLVGRTPWSAADALVGLPAESRPGGRLRTRWSAPLR